MRAGSLRHFVRIERSREQRGPGGERLGDAWEQVATDWVAIETIAAREADLAGKLAPRATGIVTMRYRPDLTMGAAMRLVEVDTGRTLHVEGVADEKNRRIELRLYVSERGAA